MFVGPVIAAGLLFEIFEIRNTLIISYNIYYQFVVSQEILANNHTFPVEVLKYFQIYLNDCFTGIVGQSETTI